MKTRKIDWLIDWCGIIILGGAASSGYWSLFSQGHHYLHHYHHPTDNLYSITNDNSEVLPCFFNLTLWHSLFLCYFFTWSSLVKGWLFWGGSMGMCLAVWGGWQVGVRGRGLVGGRIIKYGRGQDRCYRCSSISISFHIYFIYLCIYHLCIYFLSSPPFTFCFSLSFSLHLSKLTWSNSFPFPSHFLFHSFHFN